MKGITVLRKPKLDIVFDSLSRYMQEDVSTVMQYIYEQSLEVQKQRRKQD